MFLEKIKIAGFKSFVDPVTVRFPSNLVGIVGPNGCGKSNVIDAVRWVLGESSARMLRGEQMADVIFNGSSSRKPVGMAGIELVFDNSSGRIGGEFAAYNQISIRRQLTRDGQSKYFLNGNACRKRDVQDLFLGTGLGPRSYSIIEQGMISRLIEARPEELRNFLEEAAGISKYKERRRETENRIRHTRENLQRLDDLKEELDKRIGHLQRQAQIAERYRQLKQEERHLHAQCLALKWQGLQREFQQAQALAQAQDEAMRSTLARQAETDAALEDAREIYAGKSAAVARVQGAYYELGSAIARIEEAIKHSRDRQRELERQMADAGGEAQAAERHLLADGEQLQQLEAQLQSLRPELEVQREQMLLAQQRANALESNQQGWQQAWDRFNERATRPAQAAQVERARINQLEQNLQQSARRVEVLEQERDRLVDDGLEQLIVQLQEAAELTHARIEALDEEMDAQQSLLQQERSRQRVRNDELEQHKGQLRQLRGQQDTLGRLQQQAYRPDSQEQRRWLERRGLAERQRLAESMRVEPAWGKALEAVLGNLMLALPVESIDEQTRDLQGAWPDLTFFEPRAAIDEPAAGSLANRVQGPSRHLAWLQTVFCAEDLAQAMAMRASLAPGCSLVTRDGIWVGADWLRMPPGEAQYSGVLERAAMLQTLEQQTEQLQQVVEEFQQQVQQGRQQIDQLTQGIEQQRASAMDLRRQLTTDEKRLAGLLSRHEHQQQRRQQIGRELAEVTGQSQQDRQAVDTAQHRLHEALREIDSFASQREALILERDAIRAQAKQAGLELSGIRQQLQEREIEQTRLQGKTGALRQSIDRSRQLAAQASGRVAQLRDQLAELVEPLHDQETQLQKLLQERLQLESDLGEGRDQAEQADARVRELDAQRHGLEQELDQARDLLSQAKLQVQELRVRLENAEDQLQETAFERAVLLDELADRQPDLAAWENRLGQLRQQIDRLGSVNLTAIDEYRQETERRQALEEQCNDVAGSLQLLEEVIQRIDRETRNRFKETFDQVNQGLQELFPQLFGGGGAYLELTGQDLLETGVTIMARPPGKKNSTIALLSGGEKALTAVALVFAIFQLNPSPFCMLDEVDAPLDDANVGRFCELVKRMSARVQFIFITHNKVTMEIANQLNGVTMSEPGVSRLVSVDISAAVDLVESVH